MFDFCLSVRKIRRMFICAQLILMISQTRKENVKVWIKLIFNCFKIINRNQTSV